MTENAILLEGVSKAYPSWKKPGEHFWSLFFPGRAPSDPVWAVQDISLAVPRGASIGIVGVNGAGKSTLMQIVAGTLEPTEGRVKINGRVSPLLELGAGFNPDFTGWENAILSGTILGLSNRELNSKLDQIAAFADIGEFMKRPVRTYSSGMYARLAFSVAVHVDPEILLVDEILAVGDMGFQQRCLARLREMRDNGLTLIFVSHGPDSIRSVCTHALFLNGGRIVRYGTADDVVNHYLAFIRERANAQQLLQEKQWEEISNRRTELPASVRYGTGHVQIERVEVRNRAGEAHRAFDLGDEIEIEIELVALVDIANLSVSFLVRDSTGVDLFGTTTFDERRKLPDMHAGERRSLSFRFDNCLRPGSYGISVAVNRVSRRDYTDNILLDQAEGVATFLVMENVERPVHYKVHQPIRIKVPSEKQEQAA